MITEIVLWKMPDGISREEVLSKFRLSVPVWQANPDLIHKAYVFDETSRRGGGVCGRTLKPPNRRTDRPSKTA